MMHHLQQNYNIMSIEFKLKKYGDICLLCSQYFGSAFHPPNIKLGRKVTLSHYLDQLLCPLTV